MEKKASTEKKALIQVRKFNDLKPARISQELYTLDRVRWKLSTFSYRLLFALAQNIDYYENEIFPDLGFPLKTVFEYLGLESSNKRYHTLEEAVKELMREGVYFTEVKKSGGIRWKGLSWITYYSFATDEPLLNIKINPDAKPYLRDLKRYAQVQPKYYLKLYTDYQNWFYPFFKNVVKVGKWRVSIEELKFALFLENTPSYNPKESKNATEHFLKRVIGIEISEAAKKENQRAKLLKQKPTVKEWDYIRTANGSFTGTLATISQVTDINVTAGVEKTGRSNTHIIFFLSEKRGKSFSPKKTIGTEPDTAEIDMQKPQQRTRRKSKAQNMQDLFESPQQILPILNPAFVKDKVPVVRRFTQEEVKKLSQEMKMPVNLFIEKMRLQSDEKGGWFKED